MHGHAAGGGIDGLYVRGTSPVHRLAPATKIAATVAFVFAVVVTPREAVWAFGVHAGLVASVAGLAGLRPGLVVRRLRIEIPFLLFAVFMPFTGAGPRVDVLGVSLSEPGLWAAWNIAVKGTLGVAASIVLAATTPVAELLRGLDRLRVPRVVTAIAGFMVRYLGIVAGEARRMHVARQSRGYEPRWLWQARGTAASAGTLFVRSYERGERVYFAMLARGYDGSMPPLDTLGGRPSPAPPRWSAAVVPAAAWAVAAGALVV
ncbi:MAG TPA: cobalt ECF transporter T component CbiQ [Acidimicrobiales bacterium]|jgi:cobalt/nickel transport system permease protein|nr:cobalt ECF transporter T component CbiQ [Acidimicrobiales bacterium]